MTTRRSPTARHRRLIAELNRLRAGSGLSRAEVAERIGSTDTTVWRYETGLSRPKPADVEALLRVYGVTGDQWTDLIQLAKDARKRGWWHRHRQTLKPTLILASKPQHLRFGHTRLRLFLACSRRRPTHEQSSRRRP